MVKCKDCGHFISTLKTQGCGLNYPVAKCSGNLEIDCEDFITPEAEKTRQEKLFSKLPIIETPATDELIELIESINLPMNLADIKIGENYKMIKADTDFDEKFIFIKKDSVVQVLDKDSGSDLDVLVQDLSKRKTVDGVWWISHECLERIPKMKGFLYCQNCGRKISKYKIVEPGARVVCANGCREKPGKIKALKKNKERKCEDAT